MTQSIKDPLREFDEMSNISTIIKDDEGNLTIKSEDGKGSHLNKVNRHSKLQTSAEIYYHSNLDENDKMIKNKELSQSLITVTDDEDIFKSAFLSPNSTGIHLIDKEEKVRIDTSSVSDSQDDLFSDSDNACQVGSQNNQKIVETYISSGISDAPKKNTDAIYINDEVRINPSEAVSSLSNLADINITLKYSNESNDDFLTHVDDELKNFENDNEFIEICVSHPARVGEGIYSFMAYKVTTRTNKPFFQNKLFSVTRRFSDFLGLHEKLTESYQCLGYIIPPAPEKSLFSSTKIKIGFIESSEEKNEEFIVFRRAALEKWINRTALHPVLQKDKHFIEFIEYRDELPRATSTSSLSSASVLRLFGRVGHSVNRITYKMDEIDPWFEEKTQSIENLDFQLRKVYSNVEMLVQYRKDLAISTGSFGKSILQLSDNEENSSATHILASLSMVEQNLEKKYFDKVTADQLYLLELIKDYIAFIASIKEILMERIRIFQNWQHIETILIKKREQKSKMEVVGKSDKVSGVLEEIKELESSCNESKLKFQQISMNIQRELKFFEHFRILDFKKVVIKYLEQQRIIQAEIIQEWEQFLPILKNTEFE